MLVLCGWKYVGGLDSCVLCLGFGFGVPLPPNLLRPIEYSLWWGPSRSGSLTILKKHHLVHKIPCSFTDYRIDDLFLKFKCKRLDINWGPQKYIFHTKFRQKLACILKQFPIMTERFFPHWNISNYQHFSTKYIPQEKFEGEGPWNKFKHLLTQYATLSCKIRLRLHGFKLSDRKKKDNIASSNLFKLEVK